MCETVMSIGIDEWQSIYFFISIKRININNGLFKFWTRKKSLELL